jgi:hypothetical protein
MTAYLSSAHVVVACEDCHGPGYLHVRNGGRGGLLIHNPGDEPFGERHVLCDRCHPIQVDGYLQSGHALAAALTCTNCHEVHAGQEVRRSHEDNDLCMHCHALLEFGSEEAIAAHTFHPVDPAVTGASRCSACHMPPLQRLEQADGSHDHSLLTLPPITSNEAADAGADPVPPNSCSGITGCHDGTVPEAPVFNVDILGMNEALQAIFESWYGS